MPTIHPTAIVDPLAQLADDVHIGPHSVIQGPVTIGPRSILHHRVSLQGPMTIGSGNTFYPNTCIGFPPQHRAIAPGSPTAGVTIGDDNIFREGVSVHTATKDHPTTIGHRNYLMVNAHVGHDSIIENDVTMANGALLGGHVHIGSNVFLGGNSAVHQFCRVGRLAMLSGVEAISSDLPPFCVCYSTKTVSSLNVVGLRRAGLRPHMSALQSAFMILYRGRHTLSRAVEMIREQYGHDPLCAELADFVASTKRGICSYDGNVDCTETQTA
jgi:UDP-N-acetylglucosamine acyltransferase